MLLWTGSTSRDGFTNAWSRKAQFSMRASGISSMNVSRYQTSAAPGLHKQTEPLVRTIALAPQRPDHNLFSTAMPKSDLALLVVVADIVRVGVAGSHVQTFVQAVLHRSPAAPQADILGKTEKHQSLSRTSMPPQRSRTRMTYDVAGDVLFEIDGTPDCSHQRLA